MKVQAFEKYAAEYDQWFEKNKLAYLSELEAVKALMHDGGKAIEIGVGSGRFAQPLGIRFGLEPSKAMASLAKKRGVRVIRGAAEALPFRNSLFDSLLMVTTICFLDDIRISFKEAFRVLKDSGRVVIGFIDRNSPLGIMYELQKSENVFYGEANFYSVREVLSVLQQVGFRDFAFAQTIFGDLDSIESIQSEKDGYGEGSFAVVRAEK